ncbi:DUF1269 domain-containing protein [Actinomycetospora sp. TBRC 11914]|uniref:DUF1269 domain-containing protein n=1 Tax=Actinomycetospora sp. TBRC 11914 TaxID=2729387 RepID=UPI00145C4F79|nr:DUF1269 domain-containing protein [Actinomycetospora sp. TBRC 11914]NMO88217.1 DUF1269 domain-containing protein [Actinomycetospora sp. TBRC 11914]
MTTLSIWTFDTETGAETALRPLERRQNQRLLTLDDASVVAWAADAARPRTYQAGTAAGTAALSGAFWGLLFGTVFLLPLSGSTAAAGAGLAHVGLPDAFLGRVRDRIVAGTSALFLLTDDAVVDAVGEVLADTHIDLLATTLTRTQQDALTRAFSADTRSTDQTGASSGVSH